MFRGEKVGLQSREGGHWRPEPGKVGIGGLIYGYQMLQMGDGAQDREDARVEELGEGWGGQLLAGGMASSGWSGQAGPGAFLGFVWVWRGSYGTWMWS